MPANLKTESHHPDHHIGVFPASNQIAIAIMGATFVWIFTPSVSGRKKAAPAPINLITHPYILKKGCYFKHLGGIFGLFLYPCDN